MQISPYIWINCCSAQLQTDAGCGWGLGGGGGGSEPHRSAFSIRMHVLSVGAFGKMAQRQNRKPISMASSQSRRISSVAIWRARSHLYMVAVVATILPGGGGGEERDRWFECGDLWQAIGQLWPEMLLIMWTRMPTLSYNITTCVRAL